MRFLLCLFLLTNCSKVLEENSDKPLPHQFHISCRLGGGCDKNLDQYCGPFKLLKHLVSAEKDFQQFSIECMGPVGPDGSVSSVN